MWRLQPNEPRHQYVNNLREDVDPEQVVEHFDDLIIQSILEASSEDR